MAKKDTTITLTNDGSEDTIIELNKDEFYFIMELKKDGSIFINNKHVRKSKPIVDGLEQFLIDTGYIK